MKNFISIILSIILLASFVTPCFAATNAQGQSYVFTFPDGTTVEYYLDDNLMPYIIENGKKTAVILPLPHLKVTDPDLLNKLNSESYTNSNARLTPTEVYCLTIGDDYKSNVYTESVSFSSSQSYMSPKFLLDARHAGFRIRTSNVDKVSFLKGCSISFNFYFSTSKNGTWYHRTMEDFVCTGFNGEGFQCYPSTYPYARIEIFEANNINSCTLQVWTTDAY